MTTLTKPPAAASAASMQARVAEITGNYDAKVVPVPLPAEFNENFLFIGESGTGKTVFSSTFPRPYFFDFDRGIRSLGREFRDYRQYVEAPFGRKPREGMFEYGQAWDAFVKQHDEIGRLMDKGDWPYDTLVYDSLTTLQEIALSRVLVQAAKGNRYTHGGAVDPGLWYGQQNLIQNLVGEVRGWPGFKIFTAHIQKDTNEITQTVEKLPLVTGKLAGKLPIYFDEIYFLEAKTGTAGASDYVIRAHSDGIHRSARTRIKLPMGAKQDFLKSVWPRLIA